MYLWAPERLGRAPTPHSFAGTFGEAAVPRQIQDFLARVKRSPQGYEALLLTATLHVEPWSTDHLKKWIGATYDAGSFDEARAIQQRVLQELEAIHTQHLRNNEFNALVTREKLLVATVATAFNKGIKELQTRNIRWLDDFFVKALLADVPSNLEEVGKEFILYVLPLEIAERVLNSRVPETHYGRIGKALQLLAEQRVKTNAALKQRVEKERVKRRSSKEN